MRSLIIVALALVGCAQQADKSAPPADLDDRFVEYIPEQPKSVAATTVAITARPRGSRVAKDHDAPAPTQGMAPGVAAGDVGEFGGLGGAGKGVDRVAKPGLIHLDEIAITGDEVQRAQTGQLADSDSDAILSLEELAALEAEKLEAAKKEIAKKVADKSSLSRRTRHRRKTIGEDKMDGERDRRADNRFRDAPVNDPTSRLEARPDVDEFQPRDLDPWHVADDAWLHRPAITQRPARTLPRMFYFENTYLGRTAAFQERLRRLHAAVGDAAQTVRTHLPPQRLDAPGDAGLSVTTALDRDRLSAPGRVFLQVAVQGSHRYGWRRPPLDTAVVLDPHALAGAPQQARAMLDHLVGALGPKDRLGVVLATDPPQVLVDVQAVRDARTAIASLQGSAALTGVNLPAAMRTAGARLLKASTGQARVPGSQTLLVLTNGSPQHAPAARVAHDLTVQGAVTSVIDLGRDWRWWAVANAGHGQLYADQPVTAAIDAELTRLSKVVARLLRVNIKLADGVEAIRVLGSRMLADDEVKAVKAREVAADLQISKTMGVKADRGDDDDGIQTVIPFFYGGDAHVILVELWVDPPRRGMPIAEVTLRYKDMVALSNATARSQVSLASLPQPTTPAERLVRRNVRGFELAEALGRASVLVGRGEPARARSMLNALVATTPADARLLKTLRAQLRRGIAPSTQQAILAFAGQQRISHVAAPRPD